MWLSAYLASSSTPEIQIPSWNVYARHRGQLEEMLLFAIAELVCLGLVAAQSPSSLSLDAYVKAQTEAALLGISANTYAADSEYPGAIIASPATDTARAGETGGQVSSANHKLTKTNFSKDYYYSWTRDAALTMKTVINQYASGDTGLESLIKAYIENQRKLQHLDTLSGNFSTGGLGEPKVRMRLLTKCMKLTGVVLRQFYRIRWSLGSSAA